MAFGNSPGFVHMHGPSRDQFPAAIGQATSAASLSVVIASDYAISTTEGGSDPAKTTLATKDYSSVNVTTAAYVQLVAATTYSMKNLRFFDSSGSCMILAIGAAGLEVDTLYIPPGGSGTPFLVTIPAGTRISLKALDTSATSGRFLMVGLN
jgi:hypothetical protein